ncbi:MAG: hypothetical protein JNL38_15415 [Myxococcales bacterium]|nr:hypothetical protein [Myxococcales bacterium]
MSQSLLAGNGALLVREIAIARGVQRALGRLYQLDLDHEVEDYVSHARGDEREALLVREHADGALELALRIPAMARGDLDLADAAHLDPLCQIIEGVSHFVYVTDRAARGGETTQLELELQAEVDKYVVLAGIFGCSDVAASAALRARLFDDVRYTHDETTELGARYRTANTVANRFLRRLERSHVARCLWGEMRSELRRFFFMSQADKLRV